MSIGAIVTKVIDGDTIGIASNKIRLARVYAPEIDTEKGKKCKDKLESLVLDKYITYEKVGTSYDRIVAEIYDGIKNINDIMIKFVENL